MAESKIEWTHYTFNPWWGCEKVSPGCAHCYAESFAKRTGHRVWGGESPRRFFGDAHWNEPFRWDAKASASGERRRVFCASMADVFEDRDDLNSSRARLWDLIAATPNLDWLLLTKRPENAARLAPVRWLDGWPENVWAGTTAEDQERAEARVPHLLSIPSRVRFVSYEPALGAVDFRRIPNTSPPMPGCPSGAPSARIDWLIVGGESGPGARPCNIEWIRSAVEQCKAASLPVFVKQLGAAAFGYDGMHEGQMCAVSGRSFNGFRRGIPKLRHPKGGDPSEWPEDLRVREFPPCRRRERGA